MKHKTSIEAWALHALPLCAFLISRAPVFNCSLSSSSPAIGIAVKVQSRQSGHVSSSHFTVTCAVKTAIVQYCSGFMCFCCYTVISRASLIPMPPQDFSACSMKSGEGGLGMRLKCSHKSYLYIISSMHMIRLTHLTD